MTWARRFWLKLQALFHRNRSKQQLNDEMQFHLDQQIAENLAAGMNPTEARYTAMRTFGNPTVLKEDTRDTWGWIWLEQFAQDLRYAARMLGSLDAGEDAVQDALVRAFDRLADCREPDKFAGWLFLILRNRCYAERRRRQREGRPLDERDDGVAAADRPDGTFEQTEQMRALERSLLHLTPEQREVFVLKHMEGLAYDEIAGRTGATVASLKMRMHRAYDRLRDLMKEHL